MNYTEVKKEFEKHNYTLISTEYKNVNTSLDFICNKHKERGVQKIKLGNLRRNSRCPYCMIEQGNPPKKLPLPYLKEKTEEMGYEFISSYKDKQQTYIKFICKKHKEKGIQIAPWSSINSKKKSCGICNGTKRETDDFKKIIKKIHPNIRILGEYTGAKNRVKCKCEIHEYIWTPLANNLLYGYGCPKCGHAKAGRIKRTTPEQKINRLNATHPEINFLSRPILNGDYVKCMCKVCGHVWEATFSNLVNPSLRTGCPKCNMSSGEVLVSKVLDKMNIHYQIQKKFAECKDKKPLAFDFYLPDLNVLIEYDGEHHFKMLPRCKDHSQNMIQYEIIKAHDSLKNQFCVKNKIPLVRIPYWENNNIENFLKEKLDNIKF